MQKDDLIAMIDGLLDENSQAICCDEDDKDIRKMACILELWKSDLENDSPPPITQSIRNAVMYGGRFFRNDAPDSLVAMVAYFLETSKPARRAKSVSA
jgi:hypothetical protein